MNNTAMCCNWVLTTVQIESLIHSKVLSCHINVPVMYCVQVGWMGGLGAGGSGMGEEAMFAFSKLYR